MILPGTANYLQSNKTPESNKSSLGDVVDALPAEVPVTSNMKMQIYWSESHGSNQDVVQDMYSQQN
jgi:hypothetical protein